MTPSWALQHHPRCCGSVGRQAAATPAVVPLTASHQRHPRVGVWTMTRQEAPTPPPSNPLLDGYRARRDAPPQARFARTAVHSTTLYAMPSHIARTARHACKLSAPWPIKGGAVPWPQGGRRQIALTLTLSTFTTILALNLNQNLRGLEALPPLPPRL
jgi:hypothetical protein